MTTKKKTDRVLKDVVKNTKFGISNHQKTFFKQRLFLPFHDNSTAKMSSFRRLFRFRLFLVFENNNSKVRKGFLVKRRRVSCHYSNQRMFERRCYSSHFSTQITMEASRTQKNVNWRHHETSQKIIMTFQTKVFKNLKKGALCSGFCIVLKPEKYGFGGKTPTRRWRNENDLSWWFELSNWRTEGII